ncbi:hypothetical protein V3C99_004644 [Haemonchus contortus]
MENYKRPSQVKRDSRGQLACTSTVSPSSPYTVTMKLTVLLAVFVVMVAIPSLHGQAMPPYTIDPNGPMSPDRPGGAFGFGGGGLGVAIPPNMRGKRDLQGTDSF